MNLIKEDIASNIQKYNDNKSYVFLTSEGSYFKLRFTDYVDNNGNRGAPKFEFQKL